MRKLNVAAANARDALKRKVKGMEEKMLAEEGRRSVKARTRTVTKVAKKAVRAGAVAAMATAAAVVVREVRKRRKLNA